MYGRDVTAYHAREAGCASHKINLFPPTFQSFWNDLLDDGFTSKPIAFIRLGSFRGNPRLCLSVNGDQHLSFQINIKAKVGNYVYFTNVMQLENLTKSN